MSGFFYFGTTVEWSHVWWQLHDFLTHPVSDHLFFCGSPSWWRCRFQRCNINAWCGNLNTNVNVDKTSVKGAVVAHFSFACLRCWRFLLFVAQGWFFFLCSLSFEWKHTHLGKVCVVLRGHRLYGDVVVVLFTSEVFYWNWKLKINWTWNTVSGWEEGSEGWGGGGGNGGGGRRKEVREEGQRRRNAKMFGNGGERGRGTSGWCWRYSTEDPSTDIVLNMSSVRNWWTLHAVGEYANSRGRTSMAETIFSSNEMVSPPSQKHQGCRARVGKWSPRSHVACFGVSVTSFFCWRQASFSKPETIGAHQKRVSLTTIPHSWRRITVSWRSPRAERLRPLEVEKEAEPLSEPCVGTRLWSTPCDGFEGGDDPGVKTSSAQDLIAVADAEEYHLMDQLSRLEQLSGITLFLRKTFRDYINFGPEVLPGILPTCVFYAGGIWKGDVMVADNEELEEMDASELHARRLNAKEALTPMKGEKFIFPVADGTVKTSGGDQVLRTFTLIWDRPERGEEQGNHHGESDGSSSTPQRDSSWYDGDAGNDFWSISCNFIYRHHVEPRVKLHVRREESFPIPLNVTRTTNTSLEVVLETYRWLLDRWWRSRIVRYMDRFHKIHCVEWKTSGWIYMVPGKGADKKTIDLQTLYGQRFGKICLTRRNAKKSKNGLSKNRSSTLSDNCVVFSSVILMMENLRIIMKNAHASRNALQTSTWEVQGTFRVEKDCKT